MALEYYLCSAINEKTKHYAKELRVLKKGEVKMLPSWRWLTVSPDSLGY